MRSNAELYVHGHSSGGTNPSLVEAMNLRLPILAFDCIYNRTTTEGKALYWRNSYDIENLIKNNSNDFSKISLAMEEIGKRLYSWKIIAELYNKLY